MKEQRTSQLATEILGSVSDYCDNTAITEIQEEINEKMKEVIYGQESVSVRISFKDDSINDNWMRGFHFIKTFQNELDYWIKTYGVTSNEEHFMYDLSKLLSWNMNLVADKGENPLNQKTLSKVLGVSNRKVQLIMKSLEDKKGVFSIPYDKNIYYIINPYLYFKGNKIHNSIPKLFTDTGYIPSNIAKKLQP